MQVKNINKSDMIKAENLLKITAKGTYELSGMEALAYADACAWLGRIFEEMKNEYELSQRTSNAAANTDSKIKMRRKGKK